MTSPDKDSKMETREGFLEDKVALVTGGGGGIGWGISTELAREGARVAIVDINKGRGEEVLALTEQISPGHHFYQIDIREIGSFDRLLDEIAKDLGAVDILVNNAGINTGHNFLGMTPEAFDEVYGVNVRGHLFLSQAVAKKMIEAKRKGTIVFITSVHQEVVQGCPAYSSSKAALAMLIKEMAVELARYEIRVNGIAPGGIDISGRISDPQLAGKEETVLLGGRNGIPLHIGRTVVMLASEYWTEHITGQIWTVSGGQYLAPKKS